MEKSPDAFRTISEVADELGLPQHVLRFWETRFSQIKPMKRTGGRRYYRPDDIELVRAIKHLLYGEGYTIKGVQRLFKENGARAVVAAVRGGIALSPSQPVLALEHEDEDEPTVEAPAEDLAEEGAGEPAPEALRASPQAATRLAELAGELADCARLLRAARSL
ncbi:MAG: MerR family transcriptional regulator [Rhodoblastus sp.]|nr:MerR family transcriptional regulator [Rhodoblastus sp.]MCO5088044.1 MerR family transcriptional regulator [Methylobacteriaceae bacterium]